jgi:4-amino-4-deoxy-L-arabinose transferase-like glycosyltransferase
VSTSVSRDARTLRSRFGGAAPSVALIVILFVALGLRAYDLERNPPELFEDELAGAASAWSIVTTGHDVAQTHLPFLVTRLELKQPIYGFATVPFQVLLGRTIAAVRLPAVLFGALTTVLMFWVARTLGRRRWECALAAWLFAVMPWAVHYGRIGWEPSSVLPFTLGGIGLLWSGLARHRPRRVGMAAWLFAAGAYASQPALLIHVLMALVVVLTLHKHLRRPDFEALAGGGFVALVERVPPFSGRSLTGADVQASCSGT